MKTTSPSNITNNGELILETGSAVHLGSREVFTVLKLHPDGVVRRKPHWIHDHDSTPELIQGFLYHLHCNTNVSLNLFLRDEEKDRMGQKKIESE